MEWITRDSACDQRSDDFRVKYDYFESLDKGASAPFFVPTLDIYAYKCKDLSFALFIPIFFKGVCCGKNR